MHWKIKKSSFVGTSHQEQGERCQDYAHYCLIDDDNWVIGAVADGAGSAKYSEIGAKIAVEKAINYIKSKWHSKLINNEYDARQNFTVLLDIVLDELKEEAKNRSFLLKEFNSTLLVFIATNNWFTAMQIGDGLIVIKPKNGEYELVFKPDKGEYINQTTFITSSDAKSQMQVRFQLINLRFICLATDWCENISVTKRKGDWKPKHNFFNPLENCLLKNKTNIEYHHLTPESVDKFLSSEKIKQQIDDDKTLLLCVCEETEILPPPSSREVTIVPVIKPQEVVENFKNPTTSKKKLIKRIKKSSTRKQLTLLSFCLAFNIAFFMANIANFLINKPVIPYKIKKLDAQPTSDLWEKSTSQNISVWVLASVISLNKNKSILKVMNEESRPPFYRKDIPPKNKLLERPLGFLPPGNYPYFDARTFSKQKEQFRWVKIQVTLYN